MLKLVRTIRLGAVILAMAMLAGLSTPSSAETGQVRISAGKAGFIVGVGGGSGTLTFKGKTYRLSVGGISVGTIGLAQVNLSGTARNLRTAADIAGTYSAVGAGIAVVGGSKVAQLQNGNGVVITLRGVQVGVDLSLNLSGMTISLQ
jgi:hypothetical protein